MLLSIKPTHFLLKIGVIEINRDILIIGEQRCGKSSVTNQILKKYNNYESIRGDALIIPLQSAISRRTKEGNKNRIEDLALLNLSSEEIAIYFRDIYEELKIDLKSLGRSIIIDTYSLTVEDAIKYFSSDCDIYCLGMPNETTKNLKQMIKINDTRNDWTYYIGDIMLDLACNRIIRNSKTMKEQCERYNIKFFDTSGNREEKVAMIIKDIEKNTINN